MHGLVVYVKEGLPFAQDLSLENSADSYLCFRLALLHSVSYFFFLYRSPSSSLCTVFDSISSNIDEVLSINPSVNVFVFGDLISIIRTGLPILVELIDLVNCVIIFLSQMTLLRWLKFLLGSQTVILIVLLFQDFFLSSDSSICSAMVFLPLGHSNHVVVSVSFNFPSNSQWDALFHRIASDYSCTDWDGLLDHLRRVPQEDIFKRNASAAASKLCEWVQVGIDVYISHRKYQVKPH